MKSKIIIIKHTKIIKCDDCLACSNNFCEKLAKLGLNLIWYNDKKIAVNGSLSIDHGHGIYDEDGNYTKRDEVLRPHTFHIEIYEEDENPNTHHTSIMKKPSKIPTEKQCLNCLN